MEPTQEVKKTGDMESPTPTTPDTTQIVGSDEQVPNSAKESDADEESPEGTIQSPWYFNVILFSNLT